MCVCIFCQYTCKLTWHYSGSACLLPTLIPSCFSLLQKTTQNKLASDSLITATIFFGLLLLLFPFAFQAGEYSRLTQSGSSIISVPPSLLSYLPQWQRFPSVFLHMAYHTAWSGIQSPMGGIASRRDTMLKLEEQLGAHEIFCNNSFGFKQSSHLILNSNFSCLHSK